MHTYPLPALQLPEPTFGPVLKVEKVSNKVVYFQRINAKGVTEKTVEQDLLLGELGDQALDSYRALLTELFLPLLKEQGNWGKSSAENTQEFLQVCPLVLWRTGSSQVTPAGLKWNPQSFMTSISVKHSGSKVYIWPGISEAASPCHELDL